MFAGSFTFYKETLPHPASRSGWWLRRARARGPVNYVHGFIEVPEPCPGVYRNTDECPTRDGMEMEIEI